jgi:acetyl-CoA acetyltransferase family protein
VNPVEKVIAEIREIKKIWPRPFIEFADDNSFVHREHYKKLLRELAKEHLRWFTEADVRVAEDDELLGLMRDSGCQQVLIGLESPRSSSLNGVELKTKVHQNKEPDPGLMENIPGIYMAMGDTAEVDAKRYRVGRESQDEYSLLSQQRTARAQQEAFFDAEIAPMRVTRGVLDKKSGELVGKEEVTVNRDECNRPDTTLQGLLVLRPHFDPGSGHGTVTAGNSSQLSDGASATLLMSRQRADQLGIPYKLVFRGFQVAGCEPDEMGVGPVFAVPKLLNRCGLHLNDIDLWELNEAFAVQVIYCRDRLGIDPEKLNVNGGSIAIGHPFGMTGSRMVGTIANEMARRKARYGVVTMCVGGGQGAATLFERAN